MYPWALFLLIGGMFTLLVGSVVVIAGVRRAPIAREDETGFQVIEANTGRIDTGAAANVAQITS
jgi:hypothetical protein